MTGPRNETHVFNFSFTWFIYNLNTNQCYLQITCMKLIRMHEYIYSAVSLVNPLASIFCLLHSPFAWTNYPFYILTVLGDPFSCDRGANTHPLSPLVSNQLFTPCYLTHPEDTHTSSYMFTQYVFMPVFMCLSLLAGVGCNNPTVTRACWEINLRLTKLERYKLKSLWHEIF